MCKWRKAPCWFFSIGYKVLQRSWAGLDLWIVSFSLYTVKKDPEKSEFSINMLNKKVWPSTTSKTTLAFNKNKFSGSVISNKTDFPIPPRTPDLNLLGYYFWVVDELPKSLEEINLIVEDFAKRIPWDIILKVGDIFRSRRGPFLTSTQEK